MKLKKFITSTVVCALAVISLSGMSVSAAETPTNEKSFTPLAPDGWNTSTTAQQIYGDAEQEPMLSSASNSTTSITDPEEIARLAAEMDLEENPEDIVEIIVSDSSVEDDISVTRANPIGTDEDGISVTRADPIGPEEYIFTLTYHNPSKRGELIRSTDYQAPGGEMTVSESFEVTFNAESEISAEIISAKLGITVGRNVTVSDTQKVDVPAGQKRTCNAYVKIDYYEYKVTGDDILFDDDLGTLTISKPVGVIFVITR